MSGPAANKEPVIDRMTQVWVSLVSGCDRVSEAQWAMATDCPGWTVKDQLSHLIGVERLLLGDPPPPPLAEFPDHVTNAFGEMNEAWVAARRSRGRQRGAVRVGRGHQPADGAVADHAHRAVRPGGVEPGRRGALPRVHGDPGPRHAGPTSRTFGGRSGRPGGRNGVGEATVLDRCERTMPFVVGKRVAPPDGTSVLFAVTGVMGRQVHLEMHDGRAVRHAGAAGHGALGVAEHGPRVLLAARAGPGAASRVMATGQVTIEGDVAIGHRVLESMAFMI